MKLNNQTCKTAKPKDKTYKLFDGEGLFLQVQPNGSKLWRLKYRYLGKEKLLAIGAYPLISLAEARDAKNQAKKLLAQNPPIDPSKHKDDTRQAARCKAENTFKAVALEWLDNGKDGWSAGYYDKLKRRLNLHVFPYIGTRPIADITPQELLNDCLKRVEAKSYDTAARVRQTCGQVFRYGIQTGKCEWNAAENLQGALKTKPKEHYRTIDTKDLPAFLNALERNEARLFERTRRAVWLSLYTFCRPGEIRQARWQDIDFDELLWIIPAQFMKMKRDHVVPLSRQALAVLEEQREETAVFLSEWVFPSQVRPRNPISDGTVNKAIRNLGFGGKMVAHGFRALARTTIREKLRYDSEVIERQLAHKASGALGEAYDRTQFLEERIKMMQDWADFIDTQASHGKVVKVRFGGGYYD